MPFVGDKTFEDTIVPHLDAAYNLARWLTGSDADASDVVQEASIKAMRYIAMLRSADGKAWFLKIVRTSAFSFLRSQRRLIPQDGEAELIDERPSAEMKLIEKADALSVQRALEELTVHDREILVLRELEDLSYEHIAELLEIPLGTVMSRLSRARARLAQILLSKREAV